MKNKLWIIDYESANWCGGQNNVLVTAETADEAECLAENHMRETIAELFSDHVDEEEDDDVDPGDYTVNSVMEFNESHEEWEFYQQNDYYYPHV